MARMIWFEYLDEIGYFKTVYVNAERVLYVTPKGADQSVLHFGNDDTLLVDGTKPTALLRCRTCHAHFKAWARAETAESTARPAL